MFRFYRKYLKNHIPAVIINALFVGTQLVIQTFFVIQEMKTIIDDGVAAGNMDVIINSGIKMLIYTIIAVACTVVTAYMSSYIVSSVVCEARRDCMDKVYSLRLEDYNKFGGSGLLTRIMYDMVQLQTLLITGCRGLLIVLFLIVALMTLIIMIDIYLAAVLLIAFVLTISVMIFLGAKARPLFEIVQKRTERLNFLFKEKIAGARTIRAFRNEALEGNKFAAANEAVFEANIRANRKINFLSPLSLIIMNWTVIGMYIIGADRLQEGLIEISDLILIFNYLSYFIASLAVVPIMVNLVPKATVCSKRIIELLEYEMEDGGENKTIVDGINAGEVRFENVFFGYTGASDVISNVSFTAEAGKTTAIIGGTGSGKTTLINLLQGFYRISSGNITIDGISIDQIEQEYLQENISFATQRPFIFHDTVRSNITCYNSGIGEKRVSEALASSCFDEVVAGMPDGIDTMMAQGGMNVSGGQRQRLSLARAFAKEAAIYIFDDSLSALDAKTEKKVRDAIKTKLAGKTVLLVSQKIINIMDSHKIIVMDNGKIVGEGRHTQLMKTCSEYRDIYEIQCYTKGNEGIE